MTALVACPSCARHVRVSERACPFCGVELALRAVTIPARPSVRLSRAALYAFGVGALSAGTGACGGAVTTGGAAGGDSSAAEDGNNLDGQFMVEAAYGAVFVVLPDAGGEDAAPTGFDAAYGGFAVDGYDATVRDGGTTDGSADASVLCGQPAGSLGAAYGGFPCIFSPVEGGPPTFTSDAQSLVDAAYGAVPIEPDAGPTDSGSASQ